MTREGKPIPGDWDGESYSFYMLCGPDSILWHGYIKGAIYELTRGRGWDINTGNIKAAQEIAWEIYNSMAKCTDLIIVHRLLIGAITGQAVNLDDPLPDSGIVDFASVGLAAQLRTIDADKRLADVVEDLQLSPVTNVTNQVEPAAVTVNNNMDTQAIADNVEAFRVTYETQTTAETAAADTRSVNLIAAIDALKLICNTVVKCGGCGCGGGSEPPSEPGVEGDPPPTGWGPPLDPDTGEETSPGYPGYQTRKCLAANAVHEHLTNAMGQIKDINFWGIGLDTIATVLGAGWLIAIRALLLSSLGALGRLSGIAESAAGWLDELAQSLIEYGVDLTILHQALIDNQQDLVCALYNASSMLNAITDYSQVLGNAGVGFVNQNVVKAFLTADLLNIVYFERDDFEAALDGYVGPVNCGACNDWQWEYEWGGGPDPIPTDGSLFTVTSAVDPQSGYSEISLQIPVIGCAALHTVEFVSVVSGNPNNGFGVYNWAGCTYNRIVTEQLPSTGSWQACRITVTESSGSQFSVQLRITA